jgi:hypothetical protein
MTHTHEFQGQKLVHSHPGEDQEHGYFEHPEDGFPLTAGYTPRKGDRVRVTRYIRTTDGVRSDETVQVGEISNVHGLEAGGYRIWLDGRPECIFTGYQFLGAGTAASDRPGPSSLVTEVTRLDDTDGLEAYREQVAPDLAVTLDGSQCVVLNVTDPQTGVRLHQVTVTNVAALKAALDGALTAQQVMEASGNSRRYAGPDAARRARGQLTKIEAVEWLIGKSMARGHAIAVVDRAQRYAHLGSPVPARTAQGDYPVTYDAPYWRVPVDE